MSNPTAVRRAVFANLLVAGMMVCLITTGYLPLEPDLARSWPLVGGFAAWMLGAAGLSLGRRWGWYVTVAAAAIASLLAMLAGFGLILFHGLPTLQMLLHDPEVFAILGVSLIALAAIVTALHPEVRRFVHQPQHRRTR